MPFYFGLIIVMIIYTYVYVKEILHLFTQIGGLTKETAMMLVLEIVDIVMIAMIASLVKMIITGSYNSFVDKDHGYKYENASSGTLKIKISSALVGVSSIHLLQSFIHVSVISWDDLYKKMIHVAFIVGSICLAIIDYLYEKSGH